MKKLCNTCLTIYGCILPIRDGVIVKECHNCNKVCEFRKRYVYPFQQKIHKFEKGQCASCYNDLINSFDSQAEGGR